MAGAFLSRAHDAATLRSAVDALELAAFEAIA
jgi:hypothetical protein